MPTSGSTPNNMRSTSDRGGGASRSGGGGGGGGGEHQGKFALGSREGRLHSVRLHEMEVSLHVL